jgi:Class III cytochrome C family
MTHLRLDRESAGRHGRLLAFALIMVVTLMVLFAAAGSRGFGQQSKTAPHGLPAALRNQCAMCHSCPTPTKSNPCLITCPRARESTGLYTPADGPGLMLMNSMKGQYGPVAFSHRTHAQMAEMSGGCYGCHHYNDTALRILPCADCHPRERKRENINLPDLKGAYHRRCLDCHRQWTGSPDCKSCHIDKTEGKTTDQILAEFGKGKKDHPAVAAPGKKVYTTKGQEGTVVTFFHNDHTQRFGLACVDCHRQEGCVGCHDRRPEEVRTKGEAASTMDFESRHARCNSCHEGQTCTKCHTATEAQPFDHGRSSGWALRPYHAALACSRCHTTPGRFAGLKNDCSNCHAGWGAETFTHAVTGLKLDETHSAVDCVECHPGKSFGKPPVCSGCHPDKSYPQFKPGKAAGK